jgi:hypothetical protein
MEVNYLSNLDGNPFTYHEEVHGILGLAPPKDETEKQYSFLY